jgi:4-alpha-glucanotransferase
MRKSGILLHPTSLPGKWGIGDLGRQAYRFADFLAESGVQLWQVLPLSPTGFGHSPYQAYSSMAGNPLLISLETLMDQGWLSSEDLKDVPNFPESAVDFDTVIPFKTKLIKKAATAFFKNDSGPLWNDFQHFCEQSGSWLYTYSEFMALKELNDNSAWPFWEKRETKIQDMLEIKFMQYEFFREWNSLKHYCNQHGIEIIGDIPIFVAHDSADVWANPELFDLDEKGMPKTIAGVPPDYFSETGQCWGNPLYRWDAMEKSGYQWWIERIRSMLKQVDIIRIDHFRGFEKYWEIPAGSQTAVHGKWAKGPGDRFFAAIQGAFGKLPFIAEDLGFITEEVHKLRDSWEFPGMRVLQFAFGDRSLENPHKPFNFIKNCVVYTGTHDNDTTGGWFSDAKTAGTREEKDFALRYMGSNGQEPVWDFIRLALSSAADMAIIPMQDVLSLGSEARMNLPATMGDNWRWRMTDDQLQPELAARLRQMNSDYGRLPF